MAEATVQLHKALGLFLEAMREYITEQLELEYGEWEGKFYGSLYPQQKENWDRDRKNKDNPVTLIDYHHLKGFALGFKDLLRKDFKKNVTKLPTWFDELADARHKTNHYQDIDKLEIDNAFTRMITIARELDLDELEEDIAALQRGDEDSNNVENDKIEAGTLVPWFKNVQPHLDIRQGHLDESVFAASLADVARGNSREVYQNPALFFEKTFITSGIKTVANRVIAGLNGGADAENRVISLQTGFGGGKTHTLITLYHLVKLGKKGITAMAPDLLNALKTPEYNDAAVAVFTDSINDATQGRMEGDITIQTMWGEIAWQLGGMKAYEIIRKNDEARTVPQGNLFGKVLDAAGPSLILLDEVANYCVAASGVTVGSSNLADQTISFMQTLSEAVSSHDKCVLVATLPASESEVASSKQGAEILHSLTNRLGRVSADTKPVADEEIFEVIRQRLFENLGDAAQINSVIDHYHGMYSSLMTEVPDYAVKSEYRERLKRSYPFHPELIDMFRVRWASNHDFQRTRGVLRILASIVADLWKRQNSLTGSHGLIHTSDVYFENLDALTGQLKKLYGPGYDAVITGDVSGGSSNAFHIDQEKSEYGNYNLAQGIASTILLGSFGSDSGNRGGDVRFIKLCVMKPDTFNHNNVNGALDLLEGSAYYLYYTSAVSSKRYWFHTKPNINILVSKSRQDVDSGSIATLITEHLEQVRGASTLFTILVQPEADIPEQKQPTLIVLGPDHGIRDSKLAKNTEAYIKQVALKKGKHERVYRNTILFLAPFEQGVSQLQQAAREVLACKTIQNEYRGQLDADQEQDIKKKLEEANRDLGKHLVNSYQALIRYRASDGPEILPINLEQANLAQHIAYNVSQRLKDEEWMLDSLGQNLLKNQNLLPVEGKSLRVKDLYEAFLRYDDKPMISGPEAVSKTVQNYCHGRVFAVGTGDGKEYTSTWFGDDNISIDVTDDSYWLLAPKDYQKLQGDGTGEIVEPTTPGPDAPQPPGSIPVDENVRRFKSITVSGNVDIGSYSQIFNSFIAPLKEYNLEISVTVKATSKPDVIIQDNSTAYKVPKESAKQMGFTFEEEEM